MGIRRFLAGQFSCQERFESPYQNPSTVTLVSIEPLASAAPRATYSGAQCSVRGCATRAAGARCSKSRRESDGCQTSKEAS